MQGCFWPANETDIFLFGFEEAVLSSFIVRQLFYELCIVSPKGYAASL